MAFNRNNPQQQQRSVSNTFDTYFSTDRVQNEYAFVKLGCYGDKITFNFYKGMSGSGKSQTQYVSINYETLCGLVHYVINPLVRQRALDYAAGAEYKVGVWGNYAINIIDKDTKQLRTIGNFSIETKLCPTTQRNTVYLNYSNGADTWSIALGATEFASQMTLEQVGTEGMDPGDSRFQQFAYILDSIIKTWTIQISQNHLASIMMSNFVQIKNKLGIRNDKGPAKQSYQGGSSYSDGGASGGSGGSPDNGFSDDLPF